MDKGYIENGFIVDVSNARKTSDIIYELSTILDLPEAQSKKVCIKLGNVDLTSAQLTSIKALVESMNSEIEFISTASETTIKSAEELGITISKLENKVPMPEFNLEENKKEKVNQELEKALDKIFGDENSEIKTFAQGKDLKTLKENAEANAVSVENEEKTLEEYKPANTQKADLAKVSDTENLNDTQQTTDKNSSQEVKNTQQVSSETIDFKELEEFNAKLENANNIESTEEITMEEIDLKEHLKETEKLPTLYIQRTLRSGQSITSEGNIVIIGDANPGSEIIARGDITVWGVLGGIAHAGSDGNKYARIRALKMNAIQLRIADVFARRPDSINIPYIQKTDTFVPEEACIKNKQIYIHKLHEV